MDVEELDDLDELKLDFPLEVTNAIQEILPSDDPFDATDFNEIEYINNRFPTEQSLHHIDDVLDEMRLRITSIDDQIRTVVRSLSSVEQDGQASLMEAEKAISELFARFQDIKVQAGESENRVKEITRDIKQLDTAKRNLISSITTLNHLQMLSEGVDKLKSLKARREYGEVATLLQGVMNVLEHLNNYRHIPQVADLANQVDQIRNELEEQILADFRSALDGPNARRYAPSQQLAEACLVVSGLNHRVKRSIIDDVTRTQLAEYQVLYAPGESDGWLNRADLRRKWFLKAAIEFEKTMAAMFPPQWQVPARLALSFCEVTSSQLSRAMELRAQDIDVVTLLQAHKVLSELEALLAQKYSGLQHKDLKPSPSAVAAAASGSNPFEEDDDSKNPFKDDVKEAESEKPEKESQQSPFKGAICNCFLPYLKVYLDSVEKRLSEQIEKFSQDMKSYKFEHLDAEESNVIPCCGELFTIYKNVLVEYLRLSSGENLAGLTEVFQKHLREFAHHVLRQSLPRAGASLPNLPRDLNMKELSAMLTQVQTLWREGEQVKLTEDDVRRVCSVLVSAEYCHEMASKLETKLCEKSAPSPSLVAAGLPQTIAPQQPSDATAAVVVPTPLPVPSAISLSHEQDLFHAVLAQCIMLLVSHVEGQCEAALSSLAKLNWMLEQTGDQSSYVTVVGNHISSSVPFIRHNLHTSRKYFTRFCDKLAAALINKFVQQMYKCRAINSVGCEQLLLDCHALKAILLDMPVVGSQVRREPPVAYTRMVNRGMARAELVLQVVMGEYANHGELVEKFIRLLPEATMADFQKVLEMRGVREKAAPLELYRQQSNTTGSVAAGDEGTQRRNSGMSVVTSSPEHEMSKIAKLERMLKARRLIP